MKDNIKSIYKKIKEDNDPNNITGRWTREEHEKFIEGKVRYIIIEFLIAMYLYKKDWKRVETYIGSRSGAQIRSHA